MNNEDSNERVVLANSVGSNGSEGGFSFTMMVAPSSILGVEYHFFGLTTPLAYTTIILFRFPFSVTPPAELI